MKKFEGLLILSDIDGTLLRNDKSLSRENLKAIEYFKENGGKFAIITGRIPYGARGITEMIKPNAPCGCLNGGGVYDFKLNKYLFMSNLPDVSLELAECVDKTIPSVGIEVHTHEKIYFCKENHATKKHMSDEKLPLLQCHYKAVTEPMAKILFACDSENDLYDVINLLKTHPLSEKFDFIRSDEKYYEILPKGMNKGVMLKKIGEIEKGIRKIIAIGDNDNDISMLKEAHIGIAVSNASESAKRAADVITVSNEEDAVAKIIYDIEDGYNL